jgi:hypothetical protein
MVGQAPAGAISDWCRRMAGSLGSEPDLFPRAADRAALRAVESVQLFGHMQCLAGPMAHVAFAFNFSGDVTQAVHVSLSTIRCRQPLVRYKKFHLRRRFGLASKTFVYASGKPLPHFESTERRPGAPAEPTGYRFRMAGNFQGTTWYPYGTLTVREGNVPC